MKSHDIPPATPDVNEKIDRLTDLIAEFRESVNNRLDAVEARSDARFKEAEARSDARFKEMNDRLDAVEARSDARFKEAEARFDARFNGITVRLDQADVNFAARFNEMQLGMKGFQNKIRDIETAQYGIRAMQGGGGYVPQRERLEAPGGAAIEPIQAWRRKLG